MLLFFYPKATWHPIYDLIVAGRYPDDRVFTGDQRTVDVYDSNTAELVFQLQDPTASGIKSVSLFDRERTEGRNCNSAKACGVTRPEMLGWQVNKFNPRGDVIASGMGEFVQNFLNGYFPDGEEEEASKACFRRPRKV